MLWLTLSRRLVSTWQLVSYESATTVAMLTDFPRDIFFRALKGASGRLLCSRGVLLKPVFGYFYPPGRYQTRTHINNIITAAAAIVGHVATCKVAAPTMCPAPMNALTTTQTVGEACAVLVKRRPRGRPRRRALPRLRRRWYSVDHSLPLSLGALRSSV